MKKLLLFSAFLLGILGFIAVLLSKASTDLRALDVEPDYDDLDL